MATEEKVRPEQQFEEELKRFKEQKARLLKETDNFVFVYPLVGKAKFNQIQGEKDVSYYKYDVGVVTSTNLEINESDPKIKLGSFSDFIFTNTAVDLPIPLVKDIDKSTKTVKLGVNSVVDPRPLIQNKADKFPNSFCKNSKDDLAFKAFLDNCKAKGVKASITPDTKPQFYEIGTLHVPDKVLGFGYNTIVSQALKHTIGYNGVMDLDTQTDNLVDFKKRLLNLNGESELSDSFYRQIGALGRDGARPLDAGEHIYEMEDKFNHFLGKNHSVGMANVVLREALVNLTNLLVVAKGSKHEAINAVIETFKPELKNYQDAIEKLSSVKGTPSKELYNLQQRYAQIISMGNYLSDEQDVDLTDVNAINKWLTIFNYAVDISVLKALRSTYIYPFSNDVSNHTDEENFRMQGMDRLARNYLMSVTSDATKWFVEGDFRYAIFPVTEKVRNYVKANVEALFAITVPMFYTGGLNLQYLIDKLRGHVVNVEATIRLLLVPDARDLLGFLERQEEKKLVFKTEEELKTHFTGYTNVKEFEDEVAFATVFNGYLMDFYESHRTDKGFFKESFDIKLGKDGKIVIPDFSSNEKYYSYFTLRLLDYKSFRNCNVNNFKDFNIIQRLSAMDGIRNYISALKNIYFEEVFYIAVQPVVSAAIKIQAEDMRFSSDSTFEMTKRLVVKINSGDLVSDKVLAEINRNPILAISRRVIEVLIGRDATLRMHLSPGRSEQIFLASANALLESYNKEVESFKVYYSVEEIQKRFAQMAKLQQEAQQETEMAKQEVNMPSVSEVQEAMVAAANNTEVAQPKQESNITDEGVLAEVTKGSKLVASIDKSGTLEIAKSEQ